MFAKTPESATVRGAEISALALQAKARNALTWGACY